MRTLFIFLFSLSLFAVERVDFLFYLQDAGETNALMPVIDDLEGRGFAVAILAGGVAEELLAERRVWTFPDFGGGPVPKSWARGSEIDAGVLKRLRSEIEPKVVLTGVAFESQGQILDLYRGVPTFAFWDNFNSNGENPYFATARSVASRASTLLLPTSSIEADFEGEKRVVGQPTIEKWRREMQSVEKKGPPVFIGGYGKDYEEAFALFLDCAEAAGGEFLVLPHPKTDGSFEQSLLSENSPVRIVKDKPTFAAVAEADLVICHQSTVGFQALACGKAVIHIIPEGQVFESLPLKKGLSHKVHSPEEFAAALEAKAPSPETFDAIMGIPSDGVENLSRALIEAIPFHCGNTE